MLEKHWYLKRCPLFEHLAPEQIQQMELHSRIRSFAGHSPVYLPADDSTAVYLLASGRVKISHRTEDGKESILAFVGPGELFGELALIESGQREEYVEAIEPSTIVMIPREEIRQLMDKHPAVALGVTMLISLRRRRIERRLKNLLFQSNRARITHLLLDLAEDHGTANGGEIRLDIKLTHQDLASVIGSTRETVTVVLGQLRTEGLVDSGRQRIVLTKPKQLANSVNRPVPHVTRQFEQLLPAFGGL